MTSPHELKIYDTYQKRIITIGESDTVESGVLKMYSCGPTVYNYQHIGNYRAAWLGDTIRRVAELAGWRVEWVMNITDVGHLVGDADEGEDKIEKGAKREGKTVEEIVAMYTNDFLLQCRRLHLQIPEKEYRPQATQYIMQQMILALTLVKTKRAYIVEDGIYFDSAANQDLEVPFAIESQGDGEYTGREIKNTTKNPADFAIWKFVDPQSLQKWQFAQFPQAMSLLNEIKADLRPNDLPAKWGCPGWHSECVAMIASILGFKNQDPEKQFSFSEIVQSPAVIDIHTGGEDHIGTHHKNEILQSEALDFHLSQYWVHLKHVLIDGQKMSKSLGNDYRMDDILQKGFDPMDYRLMLLEHHFGEQMNFTWDKLKQSRSRLQGLRKDIAQIRSFIDLDRPDLNVEHVDFDEKQRLFYVQILTDNIQLPQFIEKYQSLVAETLSNIIRKKLLNLKNVAAIYHLEQSILDLDLWPDIPDSVMKIAHERAEAKSQKDYTLADILRDRMSEQGWSVSDFAWGFGLWKL